MKRHWLTLSVILLIHGSAARSTAQGAPPSHAAVRLVAEDDTFKAGSSAWIGVLFDLDPGWHIYWVNPGDAGDPPRMQWVLPAGFRVGEVRWPVPSRLGTPTVVDYGYETQVLLALPLQIPADYKNTAPATLAADVRYLICRDVCIPARARASMTAPSSDRTPEALAAVRELFRATRARWPQPAPAGWRVNATDAGDHFVLSLQTGSRETSARFFPLDADQIDNIAAQRLTPLARGAQLGLKKADPDAKPIDTLRGVVVLGAGSFEIAAPIARR